jgi:hypothetical protein
LSQIASAYVLSAEQIETLARPVQQKNWKEFWDDLRNTGGEVEPAYGHSGFVVNVLLAYWEEHGIQLPLSIDKPPFSAISAGDMGLQICADYSDAQIAVRALTKVPPDKSDLHHYFNEFTNDDWDEAGAAMWDGWDFILRGLARVDKANECYLLFVG